MIFLCACLVGLPTQAGSILREVYQGIEGNAISDLTNNPAYPDHPSFTGLITEFFEAPSDLDDNYGQRMHGYLVPPITGDYTFWVASDDNGSLYLSTDDSPANIQLLCDVPEWTSSEEWDKFAEQQSLPVHLLADQPYYVMALQKEGSGGDNLAVRWLRPDGLDEGPIPADYLLPFGTVFPPPGISQQPTNATAIEGTTASFMVQPSGPGVTVLWERNGQILPNTIGPTLVYGPVRLADDGSRFEATLTNKLGVTNSAIATLAVLPDTTPPTLMSAVNLSVTSVQVIFSEALETVSATSATNYTLNLGTVVTAAAFGSDAKTVVLTTTPLSYGQTYTLQVSHVLDLAETPNPIAPGSQITFLPMELHPQSLGAGLGSVQRLNTNAFDVTGGGLDFGGTTDAGEFASQTKVGSFDLQVRVDGVGVSNPFLHAGLMARASLDARSAFAGIFAASAQVGCFFESRAALGGSAGSQSPVGGFPVNYPQTWLRLRRSGNTFTGFAGFDGKSWVQLGSATIVMPATVYVGLAVSSDNANATSLARFRDFGPTLSAAGASYSPDREPLWPCSRRTGIVFSEIMFHPKPPPGVVNNLEFIELYNAGAIIEDLGRWQITGDINFTFPAGFRLEAGQFVVVAADPAGLQAVSGASGVIGPFSGSLNNGGGDVVLRDNTGAIKLETHFSNAYPWPASCDGAGHSLVLSRPSYGEDSVKAWSASELIGGSPGEMEARLPNPWQGVVINEFLAHTDPPLTDFVELYNRNNASIDLSGCFLTDSARTNKFQIPAGTVIPPRGFLMFDETELGFRLDASGETIYFVSADAGRVLDAVRFEAQENGVSSGRCPDGSDTIRRLAKLTPGAANGAWRQEELVINEIMYDPISLNNDDQYVEIYNRGTNVLDLGQWSFTAGITYQFPAGARLAPGGYAVVVPNLVRALTNYSQLNASNAFGDFKGSIKHSGERLALSKRDDLITTNELGDVVITPIHIAVSEVTFEAGGKWGHWAARGGSSLELVDPDADPLQPANWADSDETAKAPWTLVESTGRLDQGDPPMGPTRLHVSMQGEGECLVDDVEVFKVGSTNLVRNNGFESGATSWSFFGNHSASAVEAAGAYSGTQALHVRAQGDGDTGINSIRTPLFSGLTTSSTATLRAKVRWLAGWPEVLFRLQGNWYELSGRMSIPANLGTPGQRNSRAVAHAGPAVYQVSHSPALPAGNTPVVVTCRVSDPVPLRSVILRYRLDPNTTFANVTMRDDGQGGDAIAGDGLYSATLPGWGGGTLAAFQIDATDTGNVTRTFPQANSIWPVPSGSSECLILWGDPVPTGSFPHYHIWNTQGVDISRGNALDNTYRDCTLVYGLNRVIYNAGFRDKGSPYHGGAGDYAVTVPPDDLLLGVTDRVLAATGNGGEENTQLRGQVADWICRSLGLPFLHRHYIQGYRNGGQLRTVMEDLEEPDRSYAKGWFPDGGDGDLYKVAVWFEFQDDNANFDATGATLESFKATGDGYKLARYRWTFQRRSNDGTANNYTNLFDLVTAANTSSNFVGGLMAQADIEEWMRVFGYHRVTGNWDSWSFGVGQNMFLFKQPGRRFVIMPWDIDFVLGTDNGSNGTSDPLFGGQDPRINVMYSNPTFHRMLWRLYEDAVSGPMLATNYSPQVVARHTVLLQNGITTLGPTNGIYSYLEGRRKYLNTQLNSQDAKQFAITTNGGSDLTNTSSTVTLTGTAPFAVANILVNGGAYPLTWTDQKTYSLSVPLTQATNRLTLVGLDRHGIPLAGATNVITIYYPGAIQSPKGQVVISEIHYHPAQTDASFVELFNNSADTTFDLSGWRLEGAAYTFPAGAVIAPNAYVVLAKTRASFAAAYGTTTPVFDEFPGTLDPGGETLRLVKPDPNGTNDLVVSDVHYNDKLPWPPSADGQGPSLQLIDPSQDAWRVANWGVTVTNSALRVTPARLNANRQPLFPFPSVWLNEVLPNNLNGPTDNFGEHEPFIELFNSGTNTVDLSGLFLSVDPTNLTQWSFPANTTLGARQFLVLWADGQPNQSAPGSIHTSFRLDPASGLVMLSWMQGIPAAPAVLDYISYQSTPPGRSIGSFPDGEPRKRRSLYYVTPGAPNDTTFPAINVTINEFMADNASTITNSVDGKPDDWFELYNSGTNTVDLTAYSLTDNLTNATQFVIPPGYTILPGGFLLVWADGNSKDNSPTDAELHVNFKLSKSGEQLGLFSPDGVLVDGFTFGPQTTDVSMGRFPDGADLPLDVLDSPTPGTGNVVAGANNPPVVNPIPDQTVAEENLLTFTVTATEADAGQTLSFSLGADAPPGAQIDPATGGVAWTPTEAQGPGRFTFTVRATDDGLPPRTGARRVNVNVIEVNSPPALASIPDQSVDEGVELALDLSASDPDLPANHLSFSLDPGAPDGATVDPGTGQFTWTPSEGQGPGVYVITARVTDNGVPPLDATTAFTVAVNEVNNPPVFLPVEPQTVAENATIHVTVQARDPDSNPAAIIYSLDGTPPSGLTIDPNSGVISWTPTEAQGPASYPIIVRATENNASRLSTPVTFSITVLEIDQAPVLPPLSNITALEGSIVRFTVSATDADLPPQQLSFSLGAGAPPGASIDPSSGEFVWPIQDDYGAATNTIQIQVADSGPGNLSASRTFLVVVQPRFRVAINEIMYRPASAGGQFVELANGSAVTSWDISGMKLVGTSLDFTFPPHSVLKPGAFLVVAQDASAFGNIYGASLPPAGTWTGSLGSSGDDLRLVQRGSSDTTLNRVRYSAAAPWTVLTTNGVALQLIDNRRSDSRVANWTAVGAGGPLTLPWQRVVIGGTASSSTIYYYLETVGDVYLDDVRLVAGTDPDVGENLVADGDFEGDFPGPYGVSANVSSSSISTTVKHSGNASLHLVATSPGTTRGSAIYQDLPTALNQGEPYTISFWYLPNLNGGSLTVRLSGSGIRTNLSIAPDPSLIASATPDETNNVVAALDEFPPIWLSEVVPNNSGGLTDHTAAHQPWLEIFNSGLQPVSLDGWYLTTDYTKLNLWPFPSGATLGPGESRVVFADGRPGSSTPSEWHTAFRLDPARGSVALSRTQLGTPAVVDYLDYQVAAADQSFGHFSDDLLGPAVILPRPTPGEPNPPRAGVQAPAVKVALFDGATVQISWTSQLNQIYRVEYTDSLGSSWQTLTEIPAQGPISQATDTLSSGGMRYYRITVPY